MLRASLTAARAALVSNRKHSFLKNFDWHHQAHRVAVIRGKNQFQPRHSSTSHLQSRHWTSEAGHDPSYLDKPLSFTASTTRHKLRFDATSDELISVLGRIGEQYSRPEQHVKKINYSYVDPGSFAFDQVRGRQEALKARSRNGTRYRNISPKDVLIDYIRYIQPKVQHGPDHSPASLNNVYDRFCKAYMPWLQTRGWDVEDVMTWAWILTSESSERAALRLEFVGRGQKDHLPRCYLIPQFILVFLLRRQHMTAVGLQRLLEYTSRYMNSLLYTRVSFHDHVVKSSRIPNPKDDAVGMHDFIFMMIIIRLLRLARSLWPAACLSVVELFCKYMDGVHFQEKVESAAPLPTENHAALAFMYNKVLKLCGLPSNINPVESSVYQQQAQFAVLRRMSQFNPPLVVDRLGYRAVTSMQLLHSKTDREKQWAALKSVAWPPWIQEKSGLDADVGWEDGISRAQDVLLGARAAGYAPDNWDDAAQVLAGWDTDGSPTIQSRVILQQINRRSVQKGSESKNVELWAARIQATRTLEEAWSAFLNWKAQRTSSKGAKFVYQAMFEKLFRKEHSLLQRNRGLLEEDEINDYPGDTLAVHSAPSPPDTGIYLHTPPPSVEELSKQMFDDKVKPSGTLLVLLLSKSTTVDSAKTYLQAAGFPHKYIAALLFQPREFRGQFDKRYVVTDVSPPIVLAIAKVFTYLSESSLHPEGPEGHIHRPLTSLKALTHAQELLYVAQIRERLPWYRLISAYTTPQISDASLHMASSQKHPAVLGWREVWRIVQRLEQFGTKFDVEGFRRLSRSLLRAIRKAAGFVYNNRGYRNIPYHFRADLDLVLISGPRLVRKVFFEVFQPLPKPGQTRIRKSKIDPYGPLEQLLDPPDTLSSNPLFSNEPDHISINTPSVTSTSSDNPDRNAATTHMEELQLPNLLEVPRLSDLHSYIAVLGLLRHWPDLIALVEWMVCHADAIGEWSAGWNRARGDRECIVALRVYLERSWQRHPSAHVHLDWVGCSNELDESSRLALPPKSVIQRIRALVEKKQDVWGRWPTDQETQAYLLEYHLLGKVRSEGLGQRDETRKESSDGSWRQKSYRKKWYRKKY